MRKRESKRLRDKIRERERGVMEGESKKEREREREVMEREVKWERERDKVREKPFNFVKR